MKKKYYYYIWKEKDRLNYLSTIHSFQNQKTYIFLKADFQYKYEYILLRIIYKKICINFKLKEKGNI